MDARRSVHTRRPLGPMIWLLAGAAIGWAAAASFRAEPAMAQGLPNAADQRNAIIAELKGTNARLDALQQLFVSGKVVVQVKEAKADPAAGRR